MRAYLFDESTADQREAHDSGAVISHADLQNLGVIYHHCPDMGSLNAIAEQRRYKNRDEITVSRQAMGAIYDDKVRSFFDEHLHEDEEIRYILEGSGFFDVRGRSDQWIRLSLEKDDLIVLPAGIYHRFTTDTKDYIRAIRLFKDEPKWTPLNRNAHLEQNQCRKQYVSALN